jgi:hypothetical protein
MAEVAQITAITRDDGDVGDPSLTAVVEEYSGARH